MGRTFSRLSQLRPFERSPRTSSRRALLTVRLLTLLLLSATTGTIAQDTPQASVRLEPQPVGLDRPARLTLTVVTTGLRGPGGFQPSFELENFTLVGGPNINQSMRFGTGGSGRTTSYTWFLQAREVGTATVTSIVVRVGQRDIALPNQRVEVVEQAPQPPAASAQQRRQRRRRDPLSLLDAMGRPFERPAGRIREPEPAKLFLRSVVTDATPWVGQRLEYVTYLYTQTEVLDLQPLSIPTFEGFWVRDSTPLDTSPEQERVEWEGEIYIRVPLFRRTLFPLRGEAFVIDPISARLMVRKADPFWGFSRLGLPTPISKESNPVRLEVQELPPAPPGFTGAVGRLETKVSLTPDQLDVGQAATLTLEVMGSGQIEALETPVLDLPDGLTAFPAQEDVVPGRGRSARRIWRYSIIARKPGDFRIDAPALGFFDPATESYSTTEPVELTISAKPVRGSELVASTRTLHPIRSASVPIATDNADWQKLLPWAFGVPWLLGVGLLVARRPKSAAAPGGRSRSGFRLARRRARPGSKQARRKLESELRAAAQAARPRRIAAGFEQSWRDFLHEVCDIAPETAAGDWPSALLQMNPGSSIGDSINRLLEDLHYLRYAPELSATETLCDDLIARSRDLGQRLSRSAPPPNPDQIQAHDP